MRIGDLDALYDCVEARYRLSSGEEHKVERELLDAICEMPTSPAIPVEWLREKMRGYASSLKSTETAELVMVMQMWQKEQEAR